MDEDKIEFVKNNANVLLISNNQEDYDNIVKYGIKNINYFKSPVVADKYFKEHEEEFGNYHIIIYGENKFKKYCCFYPLTELDCKIAGDLRTSRIADYMNLYYFSRHEWNYALNVMCRGYYNDVKNNKKDFIKIEDYINPNKLELPKKKEDLKILVLDLGYDKTNFEKLNLGLNIELVDDDNNALGRIKDKLGDYDIILTNFYSKGIADLGAESTEQCKSTGRRLTLLATYERAYSRKKIIIHYGFGGELASTNNENKIEFSCLDKCDGTNESFRMNEVKRTIEVLVNLYNDALLECGKESISDLNFKTALEMDKEYNDYMEIYNKKLLEAKEKEQQEYKYVQYINKIRKLAIDYLKYCRNRVADNINDLRITEYFDYIKIESILQGRVLCTMTISKNYSLEESKNNKVRLFKMQTLTKKGNLSNQQELGVYTSSIKNQLKEVPTLPDERQKLVIEGLAKKMELRIEPIISKQKKNSYYKKGPKTKRYNNFNR